nr:hypothetical protein [Tanacetum cinerariifolium]
QSWRDLPRNSYLDRVEVLVMNGNPSRVNIKQLCGRYDLISLSAALTRRVEHFEYDKVAQALEITKFKRRVKKLKKGNKFKVLKLRRLQKVGTSQRVDTSDDTVMDDESNQERMIDEMDKDDAVVLMDEKEKDKKVEEAKPKVPAATLTAAPARVVAAPSRRRKGVIIRNPEEESTTSEIIPAETKSKDKGKGILVEDPKPLKKKQQIEMDEEYARKLHAELNKDIDWDVAIDHVKLKAKEDPVVQRYQDIKRKPQTEAQARKNMMMYLNNVVGFKLDYFKGMSYDDIRSIFEAKFNLNVEFLLKTKEQMEKEENIALQTINETLAEKAAKRRKLNEEVEDLKRHLEIVPDEDDDVYTEATPLARKVPVVDYEIIKLNNKPYYKIIRADGTHQFYISFLTLLKNFDREDLEALWNLVKKMFSTSKPKNFSDDFLLTTLGAMFEKPYAHAQIWKNQRTVHGQAKLILLVERRYPLSRFTLDQMLNAIKLQVEEEKKSSGSTTSHSNHSFLEYEAFCFDFEHIKEKSSGTTTSHYDFSLLEYESFHFDFSVDQFPPADRSDLYHEEFADELAHIISPPEYDHFYFDLEDDPVEVTRLFKENIPKTSSEDLTRNELNGFPLILSDCDSGFSKELFKIDLLVLFSILLLDDFSTISFVSNSLFLTDPFEIKTFLSFPSGNEDKVFDPRILINNGVFSFTIKSPHLLINNFMIDKCHILREISLMTESSVSFHLKDKGIRGESS